MPDSQPHPLDPHPLDIVDKMIRRGIDVVIVGGHAVNFHGYLRATEDVDVIFRRTPDSEQQLFELLSEIDAYWITDEIDQVTGLEKTSPVTLEYVQRTRLMMLGSRLGWIDLFDFIPGLPEEPLDELFASSTQMQDRSFVNLDWLKRMKRASGRPQDLLDLENLP
jgi:hypothetical protein